MFGTPVNVIDPSEFYVVLKNPEYHSMGWKSSELIAVLILANDYFN